MADQGDDPRIALVARLTESFGTEIDGRDPHATIPWPNLPDVASLIRHLGGVHRWAAEILRTRGPVAENAHLAVPAHHLRDWYRQGRDLLLHALASVPPDAPCWVIGDRTGTAGFWRRRMVYENAKHLIDVRASAGGRWRIAEELTPKQYADGVDELFEVFLRRSRPTLRPLPAPLSLWAIDTGNVWSVDRDWTVDARSDGDGAARSTRVLARAGDLALMLWERADPFDDSDAFAVEGDAATVGAFVSAPIHPW